MMKATENNVRQFISDWREDFIERIKEQTKSQKQNFHFGDALNRSGKKTRTELDKVMIGFLEFLETQPLLNNDYFKYVNSYKKGKELNPKYFRHDLKKLREYYAKSDKDPQYNPFSQSQYERYVLFMMLKFSDCYLPEYDGMFRVSLVDSRTDKPA